MICPKCVYTNDYSALVQNCEAHLAPLKLPITQDGPDTNLQEMVKESKQEAGKKFDNGKARMDLLDREALTQIANVLAFGAQKYDAHNWRKGMSWSRLLAAAIRHITAFNDGEDVDPETGISHLAHAGCCIMFLLNYEKKHKELDDRYKAEEVTGISGLAKSISARDRAMYPSPTSPIILHNWDYLNKQIQPL